MVPGHPPCALCSLIFSSLDPETNCEEASALQRGECFPCYSCQNSKGVLVTAIALMLQLSKLRRSFGNSIRIALPQPFGCCNWSFLNLTYCAVVKVRSKQRFRLLADLPPGQAGSSPLKTIQSQNAFSESQRFLSRTFVDVHFASLKLLNKDLLPTAIAVTKASFAFAPSL